MKHEKSEILKRQEWWRRIVARLIIRIQFSLNDVIRPMCKTIKVTIGLLQHCNICRYMYNSLTHWRHKTISAVIYLFITYIRNDIMYIAITTNGRLYNVVKKAQRYGYLPTPFKTFDELRQGLDETLFHSSKYNPHHDLYRLLPRPKATGHNLRQRAVNLTLPSDVGSTAKQNFIPRMLFTDMYWSVLPCNCVCFVYFMYIFCYAVTQVRLSFVQ